MLSRRRFIQGVSSGVVATGAVLTARPAFGRQVIAPTLTTADLKPTGPLDESYWWKVRSQFNILDGMTFMNNGTEGPVPRAVLEANERFFREIARQFPDDCWFVCAYLAGKPVAAGCGFRFADEFEMTWASSLRAYNREAPNMLVYWSCMERAIRDGARRFNFGRCTTGTGTHRFKMQWGGREEQLWWYNFALSSDTTTPSPHDRAFRWGPRVWRRLPESIATTLGPSIVRYIP